MDEKTIKKYILIGICIFMVGFGCLILYYINYSKETEARKYEEQVYISDQEIIDDLMNQNDANPTKFGNSELEYNYSDNDLDKFNEYVEDRLNLNTDQEEDEITKIYNETLKSVRLKIFQKNYSDAILEVYEVMAENVFVDDVQFITLSNIKNIGGFDKLPGAEQIFLLNGIKDASIYVSLFYTMSPSYQASILPHENLLFIPVTDENQITYLGVEDAGPLESRASEYYSDFDNLDMKKVTISVLDVGYEVFVVGNPTTEYMITNIQYANHSNMNFTNYTDYFNIYGREPVLEYSE